jgi:osmotically-inducible protein OsmY
VEIRGDSVMAHSDLRIHDDVIRTLRRRGYAPLERVAAVVQEGRVRLSGDLPSYFLVQVAQETAKLIPGVCSVENLLRVPRN